MKKIVYTLGLWLFCCATYAQNITISGLVNHYLRVDEVQIDRVRVTDVIGSQLSQFNPENKVLLIQMTGGELRTDIDYLVTESRTRKTFNHTGTFEIFQIDQIVPINASEAWIVFTDNIAGLYDAGEKIQLVKFVEGETITTSGTVTARDWNGAVGGILAIIGTDSVKLKHNLDVSAQGFRGGAIPDENYTGSCRYGLSAAIKDTLFFIQSKLNRSGNKGEGIITASWPYTKGTGFSLNGGGAGNGLYSGGGGGGNYNSGGDGGRQSPSCTGNYPALGGWGGYACFDVFKSGRIIMGGGGGSGTKLSSSTPAKGGDGGGIILLVTGVLYSENKSILASGEAGSSTTGSGGGGGAGGTVLVDVTSYSGTMTIRINGGKGSNTTSTTSCTGTGGGGSGGLLWHSGSSILSAIDSAKGAQGSATTTCLASGVSGNPGIDGHKMGALITPLRGFLFNSIRGVDTVCAGLQPKAITGSQPKGGDGSYTYFWEQSLNNITWVSALGDLTLRTLQPPALSQTTYFRRVVVSDGIYDTSRVIKVFVYPAVSNNIISGTDTICYNARAKIITGRQPAGGNGTTYLYQWQSRNNHSAWQNAGSQQSSNVSFNPGSLTENMYYRRLVSSTKYCHDTSNTEIITVLPLIGNNSFPRPDTAICTNSSPGLLNPELPTGGDGSYTYSWQVKALEGNWTTLPTSDQASNYAPAGMTMSSLFRRIVYSGNDHACIDTSSPKTVIVMPLITNNLLLGAGVKYTCFNSPITLSGSTPQNGFGSYGYGWEWSSDNIAWESIAGQQQNLITPALTQKKYFRRTVFSTPQFHECTSVSNVVEVRLNTLPAGDLIAQDVSLCSGETIYVKFTVAGHSPFSVTVQGESIAPQSKDNILASPDSVAFVPTSSMPFTMYSVRDDSGCFAHIDDFENIVHAIVYEVPVAQAGNDAEVCGLSHTLQAVKSLSGSSGLWSGDGVAFDSPNSENSVVTSTNYTTRVLRWTETNWNCQDEDDVVIVFYEQPAVPEAGPHQSLDFTFETRLDATSPVVGSGRWSVVLGSAVFDQDNLPNPVVNELSSFNILKYTITNGSCPPVSDSLEVKVEPLLIPKGFTPNGDTQNDVFNLGAEHAEWVKIKIFNSAGIIVYESDDYLMGDLFDGYNLDGVELPEGTYFYIADIKVTGRSEPVQFRSFVEILR